MAQKGLTEHITTSHVFTRPYSLWQNGKGERTDQTLAKEWTYARPSPPSSTTTIGAGRTAPAGVFRPCHV